MSAATAKEIQQHLSIEFPIKSPDDAKALAEGLPPLMPNLFKAEDNIGTVHYSRFVILGDNKLLFIADIDGDIETFVGELAKGAGPVFDFIFEHVDQPPLTPVASNSELFVGWVKHHSLKPLSTYSAYQNSSVQDVKSCARAAGLSGSSEQHPLLQSLPIKSSLRAFTLEQIVLRATKDKMKKGADSIGTLHFAHFVKLEDNHLGFFTIYDGSFAKYMQDFTDQIGPVFDVLFEYISDPPPTPVAKNSAAFLKWATGANLPAIGLYSAYPGLAVQDVKALVADAVVK